LRIIRSYRTAVTDAGVEDLAPLTQRRWLDLSNTAVTDAGLKDVASFKRLRTLNLSGTSETDAEVKKLRAALPKSSYIAC
jgi:hypothetical protein